jgi:hypothetical protein
MPHVSVHYKIYLPEGHHRQPRNASYTLEPNPSSEVDVTDPGNITPLYIPQLPFELDGEPGLANLLFWSVTDGSAGSTYDAGPLTQPVGASPLTITAWYFPEGGIGNGESGIIDDAFSAALGTFIDDTFVTVTSDPSLTSDANVVGVVPTASAETLQAALNVTSTTEPFSKWRSYGAGTPSGATLNVPAGSDGLAIAVYESTGGSVRLPKYTGAIFGTVIGGVAVDGGGSIIINGVPHPVDPWGPLTVSLVRSSLVVAGSAAAAPQLAATGRRLAATAALESIRAALPAIEKEAESGRE